MNNRRRTAAAAAGAVVSVCLPLLVRAESAPTADTGDTAWLITATALVLFMTLPGLALFYGGLVRTKNVLSILMQCFAVTCVVTLLWLIAGYGLAFGHGGSANAFIGGLDKAFFAGVGRDALSGSVPESVFAMFQLTFAIITPALVIFFATQFVKRGFGIDDSLDVSPVHGVGGVLGTVLTGVLVSSAYGGAGLAEGVSIGQQLGRQLIGIGAALAWCALLTYLILKAVGAITGLRVSDEQETEGLDLSQHGERGYSA